MLYCTSFSTQSVLPTFAVLYIFQHSICLTCYCCIVHLLALNLSYLLLLYCTSFSTQSVLPAIAVLYIFQHSICFTCYCCIVHLSALNLSYLLLLYCTSFSAQSVSFAIAPNIFDKLCEYSKHKSTKPSQYVEPTPPPFFFPLTNMCLQQEVDERISVLLPKSSQESFPRVFTAGHLDQDLIAACVAIHKVLHATYREE